METSSGSRVRREGTIPISSRAYPLRPVLPRPISTCVMPAILTAAVIGGFHRHLDVVRVALLEPGRGDRHQLAPLVHLGDGPASGVPHALVQAADQLVGDGGQRTA